MWVGPDQRKKRFNLEKDTELILARKKNIPNFQRSHLQCILSDYGLLGDIHLKVMKGNDFLCS